MNAPDSEDGTIRKELTVDDGEAGTRLDQWLASRCRPSLSRSRIRILIEGGCVTIDGNIVREPKKKVVRGGRVCLELPPPESPVPLPEYIPLEILHEDDQLIVLNKPPGMVVHPGAGNPDGTLVNALLHHCGDSLSGIGGVRRPGIVHRLDKDTSGVMVVAKTDLAHRILSAAFADHGRQGDLERAYEALVWGAPECARGRIDAPLGRAPHERTRRAVVSASQSDARQAITHYAVLERYGNSSSQPVASRLECRLETGRTHQIRVHMAHIGHPLIGDTTYGQGFVSKVRALSVQIGDSIVAMNRQALHARLLVFRHPASQRICRFEAPVPDDMRNVMTRMRRA